MVRSYQRKTLAQPADREILVRCEDRDDLNVPLIAEVLIRIALRSQATTPEKRLGTPGLSLFLHDTLSQKQ